MSDPDTTTPDGWSETSETASSDEQTYVYHVDDDERVLVELTSPPNTPDEIRLDVSSIERTATVQRHDFVVATYDRKADGVADMISFMELVSERLPAEYAEDERLFEAVQRCIETFNATTDSWWSFFTN